MVLMQKVNLSLSELLSENTPVFIKNYGRGALATASFRGTAASHTQLNWNGLEINSPMTGMVDFSLIPVYLIDNLSLKYGSASLSEGSGGLGGLIDISNKAEWENKVNVKYVQGLGSYTTFNEFLQLGFGNRKIQSNTRLYLNYSENDYTFVNRGIGEVDPISGDIIYPTDTNKNADYLIYGFLQEIYFKPDDKNVISGKWWWQDARRTIPRATSYEGPNNANLNKQKDRDSRLVIDWKRYWKKSSFILLGGYSSKALEYTLENEVQGLGPVSAVFSESRINTFSGKLSYAYDIAEGLSIETRLNTDWHDVNTEDTVAGTGYEEKRSEISWFLSVRKGFADRVNLNLMLRQDWVDYNLVPIIPYFGFDFRVIRGKDLFLKGNVARNYHQPSLNELYWQPGGNPDLKAEKGFSVELGAEYQFSLSDHQIKTEITAFRSDIDNWIIWIPTFKGYWMPENINRVLSRGIEVDLRLKGSFGLFKYTVAGNYAYTSSVNYGDEEVWGNGSYGKQLPYIPEHSGNAFVNLFYEGFFITYQHNSYSERYTTSSNDITRRDRLYPYFMNDVSFGKEFQIRQVALMAEFKIYNLFNEKYHTVLYRPMPGRNWLLTIMIKY
jgi:iron complex outermembrane receptor protein